MNDKALRRHLDDKVYDMSSAWHLLIHEELRVYGLYPICDH